MKNPIFKTATVIMFLLTVTAIYLLHTSGMPGKQIFIILFFITAFSVYLGVGLYTRPKEEEEIWGVSTDWLLFTPDEVKVTDSRFCMFVGSRKQCKAWIEVFQPKG
jgi:hypothetical protein